MTPRAAHLAIRFGWGLLGMFAITAALIGDISLAPRRFQGAYLIGFAGYFLIVATVTRAKNRDALGRWAWWLVGAAVLRVIPVAMQPSDDTYRYVWEGRVQRAGHSPYVVPPNDPRLAELRTEDWSRINHPHFPAIYPPLAQLEFRLVSMIHPSIHTVKALHVLWDVLTVALLGVKNRLSLIVVAAAEVPATVIVLPPLPPKVVSDARLVPL